MLSFAAYLRARTHFDRLLIPPRDRPILSSYINTLLTHVVKYVEPRDPSVSRQLRSPALATLLAGYHREDTEIRGPTDDHCPIPISGPLVSLVLTEITAEFDNAPHLATLYRAVLLAEYGFGSRVYELLDHDHGASAKRTRETDRSWINHAAIVDSLLFRFGNEWVSAAHAAAYTDQPCFVVGIHPRHTKNHPDGAPPSYVWYNASGADAPFCIVDALRRHAVAHCTGAQPTAMLFAGANDDVLRRLLKRVAARHGLNPDRVHIRGLRSGCCMATSPDTMADPEALATRVQQHYQGWREGGQRPYAHGLMGLGQIKSLGLYDMTVNTVADLRARFMRASLRTGDS